MAFLGDLERFIAQNLYPLRLPIAIALVVAIAGLAVLAYRRRWDLAARARPRVTAAIIVPLLVIGLPLAWYLGSPLFITTRLNEPPPPTGAAAVPTPGASVTPSGTPDDAASPEPSPTASPSPALERSGTFHGADDFHFGSGVARLIPAADGSWTVRFQDFAVRNGPDLFVYLSPSPDGYDKGALELGTLKATEGAFNYRLPAGTDPAAYRSVVVWCKQFAVQFAHATLGP